MAIPTIAHNSPSPGHISWGTFTIQFNGISYSVPAGSSNQKWVWWEYRNGSPIITSGPAVPSTLTDDDLVLFANKSGIAFRVQSSNFVDGELLVDGSIVADALAANIISSEHIIATGLDAEVIKFGTMHGNRIAVDTLSGDRILAGSVAASKLSVADWDNYVSDPYFDLDRWTLTNGVSIVEILDMPLDIGRGRVLRFDAGVPNGTTKSSYNVDMFSLDSAQPIRASVWVRKITNAAAPTGRAELRVRHWDIDGVNSSPYYLNQGVNTSTMTQNVWYEIVLDEALLPADRVSARMDLLIIGVNEADDFEFAIPSINKKANGKLIVDGSITADQIQAEAITSEKVSAGAIEADHISIGTLTGDLLASEFVFGTTIRAADLNEDGGVIGAYAEMGPDGILTVDPDGNPIASLPLSASNNAYLKAHVDLLSADVRDNFRMRGTNNSIAADAELTLDTGVSPPSAPPVVQEVWDQLQLDTTTESEPHVASEGFSLGTFALNPSQITSIDWDATWGCWVVCQQKSNGFRKWRFDANGQIYKNFGTGRNWVDDLNGGQKASICYEAAYGTQSQMYKRGSDWCIWGKTPTGVDVINTIPNSWFVDVDSRPPRLIFSTTTNEYKLVQNNGGGNGTINIRSFTLRTGANLPNAISTGVNDLKPGTGTTQRVNGAVLGPQLTGSGTNWAITVDSHLVAYAFNSAGDPLNTNGNYYRWGLSSSCLGSCWTGSQFASVDSNGKITFYENWTTTAEPSYMHFGASAFDSDVNGDKANPHIGQTAGQHETPVGSFTTLNPKRRSKIRIVMPETNDGGGVDDPDKWKLYFARSSSANKPTDKNVLKYIGSVGSPTAPTAIVISSDPVGVVPPGGISGQPTSLNNFPAANAARIESAGADTSPYIQLRGDGAGRAGPLSWNNVGVLTSMPAPIGSVFMLAGAALPGDCLRCEGQGLSTSQYSKLFEAIGYTWGGSGLTFYLPDLRRRFVWGASPADGLALGHSDSVADTSSRNPQHTHTISGQTGHTQISAGAGSGQTNLVRFSQYDGHSHGGSTGAGGMAGGSSANTFPNAALYYVIKAL